MFPPLPHGRGSVGWFHGDEVGRNWRAFQAARAKAVPTMLGGGKRVLPSNVCLKLDLVDERRFANGMVYLRYHAAD